MNALEVDLALLRAPGNTETVKERLVWHLLSDELQDVRKIASEILQLNQLEASEGIENILHYVRNILEGSTLKGLNVDGQWALLVFALSFLFEFTSSNFVGPAPSGDFKASQASLDDARKVLSSDGEEVDASCRRPDYLATAVLLLVKNELCPDIFLAKVWAARCMLMWQRSLSFMSYTLYEACSKMYMDIIGFAQMLAPDDTSLVPFLMTEHANVHTLSFYTGRAGSLIEQVSEEVGMQVRLTGRMGRRTKFQLESKALMVAEVTFKDKVADVPCCAGEDVPKIIEIEDDTLLRVPKYDEVDESTSDPADLSCLQQALVLAMCLHKKAKTLSSALAAEEIEPYVHVLLRNNQSWAIEASALLLKSDVDGMKNRTREKATLQIQEIIDAFARSEPRTSFRLKHLFHSSLPPWWDLHKALGKIYSEMLAHSSAIEMYESIGMHAEVIKCHLLKGDRVKAEELGRKAVENNSTPSLLCLMGEITRDPSYFKKAWESSGGHYSAAQRALGNYYFNREEWADAADCFSTGLEINPLFPNVWFTLGLTYMRLKNPKKALYSFKRVVSIDPENYQAWNNAASVALELGNKREAFQSLREAVKRDRRNWRIWQNYVYVCIDVGEFTSAIQGIRELMALKKETQTLREVRLDYEAALILVEVVERNLSDARGNRWGAQSGKVMELFSDLAKMDISPDIFYGLSRLYKIAKDSAKEVEFLAKRLRVSKKAGWEKEKTSAMRVIQVATELISVLLEYDGAGEDACFGAVSMISGVLHQTEDSYSDTEEWKVLQDLYRKAQP